MTRRDVLAAAMLAGAAGTMAGCAGKGDPAPAQRTAAGELILCGAEEVFILSLDHDPQAPPRKVWSWRAADCPDIPEPMHRSFRSTDDCKPVDGGARILISSSSGAVALVDRASGRASFCAPVVNAHSIEMLPGGRIAAAASVSETAGANRIIVFDAASGRELASDALVSAHGLVWDAQRQILWALGHDELRGYTVKNDGGAVRLAVEFKADLPDPNGHDLSPIPGTSRLFVSTGKHCWTFEREKRQFSPHDFLADAAHVKSHSVCPATDRIAFIQAEGEDWWAQRVHLRNPEGTIHLPGQRLYKARWLARA